MKNVNQFGGNWTEAKMKIVVDYAKAYLTIMNKQPWVKTLYFDGFAGSGLIEKNEAEDAIKGTALRILDIDEPKPFDLYYFVEKDEKNKKALENKVSIEYPKKKAFVVQDDCNAKLLDMARYLQKNKNFRALAFIDPYGMSVNWNSIEALKGLGIDFWILVPTGLGVNRLLTKSGEIDDGWLNKLEQFLGISRTDVYNRFYKKDIVNTLFGELEILNKEKAAIEKASKLYSERLKTVFEYVSEPFVMRNKTNSIMYHFMMATNNPSGLKIANEVIKPQYKL
ncbi:three-Cys-motif partner protein TcmP [Mucilaginibacter sp. JRF]|uniref:three-Cys-motif partner protein TcmP n=1 Tax=Mucilaginibacter sp. JRF TaxID=2780088 RepID=UPI0018823EA9|nr:three-Cys-motif partner protein TcmP [Mucilaginibacter sp. JRF]MBE9585558.1 three-Cys-motif partner protein TcmP [Mucilaginibacter sp. JRF]